MNTNKLNHINLLIRIVLILGMSLPFFCYSQKVKTDTTEEKMDEESFKKLKSGYNYVIQAEEEELSIFKINLLSPTFYLLNDWEKDTMSFDVFNFSFEHKWKPNWSWATGVNLEGNGDELTSINVWGGVRYYYNMNKRILKGKSANNFSADYLGLSLVNNYKPPKKDIGISLNVVYGLQRRLGKFGYINFEIGMENIIKPHSNTKERVDLLLDLQVGLAF